MVQGTATCASFIGAAERPTQFGFLSLLCDQLDDLFSPLSICCVVAAAVSVAPCI